MVSLVVLRLCKVQRQFKQRAKPPQTAEYAGAAGTCRYGFNALYQAVAGINVYTRVAVVEAGVG